MSTPKPTPVLNHCGHCGAQLATSAAPALSPAAKAEAIKKLHGSQRRLYNLLPDVGALSGEELAEKLPEREPASIVTSLAKLRGLGLVRREGTGQSGQPYRWSRA